MPPPAATHIESKPTCANFQVPKSGWVLKKFIIDRAVEHSEDLLKYLEIERRLRRHSFSLGYATGCRSVYSSEQMLRAVLLRMLNKRQYVADFVEDLETSRQARVVCHFKDGQTPSASTFSRFYKSLSKYDELLWGTFTELGVSIGALIAEARETDLLGDDAPPFGHILAIDSTDIEAFGDPNGRRHVDKEMIVRVVDGKEKLEKVHLKPVSPGQCKSKISGCCTQRTDLDAAWGFRTDKRSKEGKSAFFGYKMHTIVDAYYGTPLFFKILPANESDMNQLRPLVEEVLRRYPWLSPKYLLGDKGYDSLEHFVWLRSIGIIPIIAVRRPPKVEFNGRERRLYDGTYTEGGFPLCLGNVPIQFIGSDPGTWTSVQMSRRRL